MKRLEMVADDIHSRLENEFLREEEPPHRNRIFQALRKMLAMKTTLSAYRAFFRQLGKERAKLYKPFQKGVLEWNDVYPLPLFAGGFHRAAGEPAHQAPGHRRDAGLQPHPIRGAQPAVPMSQDHLGGLQPVHQPQLPLFPGGAPPVL